MNIGVLALQGDFVDHARILKKLKCNVVQVRSSEQLKNLDGLIIPGGESTTIMNLIKKSKLAKSIKKLKIPIYGTCAGAIVLANSVSNPKQDSLDLIDISIQRNAFGRQLDSFETKLTIKGLKEKFLGVFIRAPKINNSNNATILAKFNNSPVLIKKDNILLSTFHPELTNDSRIHKLFLNMVKLYK